MASPKVVFYLMCLFWAIIAIRSSTIQQERCFVSANVGDNVTLQCSFEAKLVTRFHWFKQSMGQKPRLIAALYAFEKKSTLYNEFANNPRLTLETENNKNHLMITDLRVSDSASYYCAAGYASHIEFGEGTTVSVKSSGLNILTLVDQSTSETIQPGGSATLSCTVHTGTCDGQNSVYWFKSSEESHPGLIYTHGGRNDQCEKKPDTQTHTCVYNMAMESLNMSDAGTYYCAVVTCGHIVFGNGTKLDFEDGDSFDLVNVLSGALAFSTTLSLSLAFLLCILNKRSRESQVRFSSAFTQNAEDYNNEDNLQYAALEVNQASRSRRQRNNACQDECVYTSVKD